MNVKQALKAKNKLLDDLETQAGRVIVAGSERAKRRAFENEIASTKESIKKYKESYEQLNKPEEKKP